MVFKDFYVFVLLDESSLSMGRVKMPISTYNTHVGTHGSIAYQRMDLWGPSALMTLRCAGICKQL